MLTAALVLPACDSKADDAAPTEGDAQAKADAPAKPAAAAEPPQEKGPFEALLERRVLAESGLGVGGKLSAFDILNPEAEKPYCQVCKYGPNPKLMAVGTANDEAFRKDLKDLDAIVKKYGADKVKAFAVITDIDGGKATMPSDPEAAQAKAKALKAELGLDFPVVVPAPITDGANPVWERYYNITTSRTFMFSDGANEVKYSAVEPEDFAALGTAIEAVI